MATIRRESKLNGTLTIETNKEKFVLNSTDHGDFDMEIFLTAKNDKLTTTYEFDITLTSYSTRIDTSLGQKLVLFDSNKKYCILTQNKSYPTSTCSNSCGGTFYKHNWEYNIDEENIEKLKDLHNGIKMRLETTTSYVEFYTSSRSNIHNIVFYMNDSIKIAQKAILKSSDDILNF